MAVVDVARAVVNWAGLAGGIVILYHLIRAVYNIFFHPLASFPGPKLWIANRLPYVVSLWNGNLAHDIYNFHQKYGDIIRVSPDELSVAREEGWSDVYANQPGGRRALPKNPIWWKEMPGRTYSLVSALDPAVHSRIRRLISYCFSNNALRSQESVIQHYVDSLVQRLKERVESSKSDGAVIDMVEWLQFTTCDVIGDLVLGESFGCLEKGKYHKWIADFFAFFEMGAKAAGVRFYPWLENMAWHLMPANVAKLASDNFDFVVEKVHKRMNLEKQRDDFMAEVLRHNEKGANTGMSVAEIEATFNMMIMAGSETTVTALTGMFTHLLQNADVLEKLVNEIRTAFKTPEDMTFGAVEELPYLKAVIQEGLRMCPPIPTALSRIVPKGGAIVCGQYLPAGTQIGVHQWSTHYSPTLFHLPNDFKPERWLPSATQNPASPYYNDVRSAAQPFLVGPTSCLGKELAWAEMRLITSKFLWNFDVTEAPEKPVKDWWSQKTYVIMFKHPLWMKITHRKYRKGLDI